MFKKLYFLLAATCLVAVIINSCKKDSHTNQQQSVITDPAILQAKNWYESTYPATNTKLSTLATGSTIDLSQLIKPDWQHNTSYTRFNQSVLELPVDASSVKTAISLSNSSNGNPVYKKEYSRSSFLTLNNGTGYKAYVMTVIADSSYLKGDLTKLDHNKYNKHDADFSGVVIYSTPKGAFVSGWFYKNGSITGKISSPKAGAGHTGTGSKVAVNGLKTNMLNCTDWYTAHYVNGNLVLDDYIGSTGDCSEGIPTLPGSGGGTSGGDGDGSTGGGGIIPPDDPCAGLHSVSPGQAVNSTKEVNIVNPNPPDGSPDPGDGGFPPPEPPAQPSTPCGVPASIPVPTIIDSLKKKYPCAGALIASLPNLNTKIATLIYQAFSTNTSNNIIFLEGDPAHFTGTDADEDGYTNTDKVNGILISSIYINPAVLANSSNEYRLVTLYHEALHAFLNSEHSTLGNDGFAAKYPMINVSPRQNFSQVVNADKYDYYIDPAYQTKIVGKDHLTMADYFVNGLRDAILAYNPNFPPDRALALAQTGIIQTKSDLFKNYNDAERDVTKGASVGHKCSP